MLQERSIFEGERPDYSAGLERYAQWPREVYGRCLFRKADFWTGRKQRRELYVVYHDKAKAQLQNHLKEPFQLADSPPLVQQGWYYAGKTQPEDAAIPYRFMQSELAAYRSLVDNRDFMTTCKSKGSCQRLLDLLALDHRYLTICDALSNHAKEPIREVVAAETISVLRDGRHHDDDSGLEQGDGGAAARARTPPTPPGGGEG